MHFHKRRRLCDLLFGLLYLLVWSFQHVFWTVFSFLWIVSIISVCCQMNDVLLYTYPQQDGKYRLKNTLPLTGLTVRVFLKVSNETMFTFKLPPSLFAIKNVVKIHVFFKWNYSFICSWQRIEKCVATSLSEWKAFLFWFMILLFFQVSKPIVENVQNALKIEGTDISITLSARWVTHKKRLKLTSKNRIDMFLLRWPVVCSSFIEREDWFYTLSRTVTEHARGSVAFNSCLGEVSQHQCFLNPAYPHPTGLMSLLDVIDQRVSLFLRVFFRPEIVCGWSLEKKPPRLFQSHKWWCAWTAPQISASLFEDTIAMAAEEWGTHKYNTLLYETLLSLKRLNNLCL